MSMSFDPLPVMRTLWPSGTAANEVYAVLDGAQDRRIEHLLLLWGLEHECLYGAVGPDLRNAAPFLVRLDPESPATQELLREAISQEWGIFAVCAEALGFRPALRHFRRLLRVLDHEGEVLLFRYYDPVVLRQVFDSWSAADIKSIRGPFSQIYADFGGSGVT